MLVRAISVILAVVMLSFLYGCKGGGERLFDSSGNDDSRIEIDNESEGDSFFPSVPVGNKSWNEIKVSFNTTPAVGSIIQPKVELIDYQGNRFQIGHHFVDWESSDQTIVSYNQSYQALVFSQLGNVEIKAKYGDLESKVISVTVEAEVLIGLELMTYAKPVDLAFSPNLGVGGGRNFYVSAEYSNGHFVDVTDIANWSVSDSSIIAINPNYKGGVLAVGEGLADLIVEYQGYQERIDIYVYDADVLGYPVACGVSDIVVPAPKQHKNLVFRCPPLGQRIGDYNSTQILGAPQGIINGILPWFTFQSAENYCDSIGYRLPFWKEHLVLRARINSGVTYPNGPYLDYGWPQLQGYWLADESFTPGQRYQAGFNKHKQILKDETSWNEVTAVCVKDQYLLN